MVPQVPKRRGSVSARNNPVSSVSKEEEDVKTSQSKHRDIFNEYNAPTDVKAHSAASLRGYTQSLQGAKRRYSDAGFGDGVTEMADMLVHIGLPSALRSASDKFKPLETLPQKHVAKPWHAAMQKFLADGHCKFFVKP